MLVHHRWYYPHSLNDSPHTPVHLVKPLVQRRVFLRGIPPGERMSSDKTLLKVLVGWDGAG